ncbi:MAG: peptide deformylase [Enterobacterales bacterium]
MSLFKIIYYPDIRLRKIAKPVVKIDNQIKIVVENMFNIMYKNNGIGLSATQINFNKQIIIVDVSKNKTKPLIFINPKILKKSGLICYNEGCLSIPGYHYKINRSKILNIRALDLNFNTFQIQTDNLLSVCIQHEIDHLIGKLFIDYLSPLKRKFFEKKIKKINQNILKNKKNTFKRKYI